MENTEIPQITETKTTTQTISIQHEYISENQDEFCMIRLIYLSLFICN